MMWAKTFIGLVVAAMLAGCQSMPWQKGSSDPSADLPPLDDTRASEIPVVSEPGLKLSPSQRFPDVPLPVGVKEDHERTFVYETASLKIGNMVYVTRDDLTDLAQFYVRECPTAGWQLDSAVKADAYKLHFRKSGKRLIVTIEDLGVSRGRMLTLLLVPDDGS